MATYGDIRGRALRLIGNPEGEGIEEDLILDSICAAHDAILLWVPKVAQTSVTGDGDTTAFDLPSNFYTMEAVIVNVTGEILGKAVFSPGAYFGETIAATNSWLLLPTGQISFSKPLDSSEIYDLYYCALWTKPTSSTSSSDELEPPDHLAHAMSIYAAAYILMPDAMGVAGIGSYKTRVDSGNPEHNPVEKAITFLLNLFNQEMNRHPKYQRAQT